MTWRSEDTCEVWPLCATWSGSICMSDLLKKVAAHIRHLQAERHRDGRTRWKEQDERKGAHKKEKKKKKGKRKKQYSK